MKCYLGVRGDPINPEEPNPPGPAALELHVVIIKLVTMRFAKIDTPAIAQIPWRNITIKFFYLKMILDDDEMII